MPLLFSTHTTCPTHHILIDLPILIISDMDKLEAPHYALFPILLLNTTITNILKDYRYLYMSCTHTFNTAHYLTNYIKISIRTSTYTCMSPERTGNLPDCRRELVLRLLPRAVPSGIKKATKRAHITRNDPNTNGGPGTSCNIQ